MVMPVSSAPRTLRAYMNVPALSRVADALVVAGIIIAFLYLGSAVLQPLVIAALLSFILTPIILKLRRFGIGRTSAVIATVLSAIVVIGALGWVMTSQIADLANQLPSYEYNLRQKVKDIRGLSGSSNALERASETLKDLQAEIADPPQQDTVVGQLQTVDPSKPVVVEVRQTKPPALEAVTSLVQPLISPLAMTGLALLFLIFILLEREDIRDRILRLAGTSDLQRSTAAMDEAARRLSRFLLAQTALNAAFGMFIACGLWLIGIPNPVLWGILAGLMRFVPFIGSFIAAAFPVALAAAVDPGWSMLVMTALLFIISEPIAGHVIEPLIYGRNTGLSPIAIVAATMFWTLLWGPIGLLLATPLTVCLVVLGRHVEALSFIDVLLSDQPALQPGQRLYQRLLAGDADEAADQAEAALRSQPAIRYFDDVALAALAMAHADAASGRLSSDKEARVATVIGEIIEDIADIDGKQENDDDDNQDAKIRPPSAKKEAKLTPQDDDNIVRPIPVVCISAKSELDHAANLLLAEALRREGRLVSIVQGFDSTVAKSISENPPAAIVISSFGVENSSARVRFLIRRMRRAVPKANIIAAIWLFNEQDRKNRDWDKAIGADAVVHTIAAGRDYVLNLEAAGIDKPSQPLTDEEDFRKPLVPAA